MYLFSTKLFFAPKTFFSPRHGKLHQYPLLAMVPPATAFTKAVKTSVFYRVTTTNVQACLVLKIDQTTFY